LSFVLFAALSQCAIAAQSTPHAADSQLAAPSLAFDVISIKPDKSATGGFHLRYTSDGIDAENISPIMMMRLAYGLLSSNDNLCLGIPDWAKNERFDVKAKVGDANVKAYQQLSRDEHNQMLASVLKERFNLAAHKETREGKVYALVIAKSGPRLKESAADANASQQSSDGHLTAQGVPMVGLTIFLTQKLGTTVLDKTGLTGAYDVTLRWTPESTAAMPGDPPSTGADAPDAPSLVTALEEQLGLKLVQQKGPVEYLVVDHIERPSAN
jgi:uncharacterized protein (TIGR03435 family)